MGTNFCNYNDIPKRIFKCCSVKEKEIYIFLNLYFPEHIFEKDNDVTWLEGNERFYGKITGLVGGKFKIEIRGDKKKRFKFPEEINIIHPYDKQINIILENIRNKESNPFKNTDDSTIEGLKKYLGDVDIIKELFPLKDKGFDYKFIFHEMIYEDDTNDMVLKKISQYCSPINFENCQYIYASYFNSEGNNKSLGFSYKDSEPIHPNDLINKKLCDILEIESDEKLFNIINKEYEKIVETNDIKDNIVYFINLNDFVEQHELNTIDFKKCDDTDYEISTFKNKIINKYWPQLINKKMEDIIGETTDKLEEYKQESMKIFHYSVINKLIHSSIDKKGEYFEPCDETYIEYFKKTKKQSKSLSVDLYKLFTNLKLNDSLPFVKWSSTTGGNKYYKLFKDSIIYEGYNEFEKGNKHLEFSTCQEWIKDFYRSKKVSLEKINRFDVLHKDDMISFKIFSKSGKYCTLSIYIDGTLDLIIKKDNNITVSSKEEVFELFKTSNDLIKQINDENKYSDVKLDDFGDDNAIKDILEIESVDFIDAQISYNKGKYEVTNGVDNLEEKENSELLPPFLKGEKNKLFIPILRKVCNNLNVFFRYMNEDDEENLRTNTIGLQYTRTNDFTDSNTIQSLITVYLNKGIYEEESEIINDIVDVFNVSPDYVKMELESIKESEKLKDKYRKVTVVDEDTPNITISMRTNFIDFEIRNMKSFMEFQRITTLTKVIMSLFKKYVNNDKIYEEKYLGSLFTEDTLKIKSEIIEEKKTVNLQDFMDDSLSSSEESSDISSSESSLENASDNSSMSEVDGRGQTGGAQLRSYYLKRLKENDKELFNPSKPWTVKQKNGDLYGYAKQCGAAIDRHPISITTDQLKTINDSESMGSGKGAYSNVISVPRRSKNIVYMCPQYWDISRDIPLTKEYVDKHKKDIIKNKENKENNTILERKGKYWDGIPNEDSQKHILVGFPKQIIHPDKYKLPCCFSKRSLEKEYGEEEEIDEMEEEVEKPKPKPSPKPLDKKLCKINTKESIPISIGQCSQLPKKLKVMLSQDKIFDYDPNLSISNGFVRKGVEQNESDFVFTKSSFINSYIEITGYKGDSNTFIKEIITKLRKNIKLYQYCPSLHKLFRKGDLSKEDKEDLINNYLGKKSKNVRDRFTNDKINSLIKILRNDDGKGMTNELNYIYSIISSLKIYIDFLNSDEEKKDEFIIPVLNSISDEKVNIIVFEKENDNVKIKYTEQVNTDKYCFMIKESHYYEPIVYRVNIVKSQYEIKILSKEIFNSYNIFDKDTFKNLLLSPYPRGRNPNIRSGSDKANKLPCKKSDKYCTEWISFKSLEKIPSGTELRWINNDVENCPNSGVKNYGKYKSHNQTKVTTDNGEKVDINKVFVKTEKQVHPKLRDGLKDKNNWIWIDRDCDNIHDKDIESLMRKKYDKSGDKLLLDLSTKKVKIKDDDNLILKAMESTFFLANRILSDVEKLKFVDKIEYIDIENDGLLHYINSYSEITHVIYKRTDGDIILPIKPKKISVDYPDIDIIYDIIDYPPFGFVKKYLDKLNIEITNIILDEGDNVSCVYTEGGMIPVKSEKIKGISNYDTIKSELNPFEIDKYIISNNSPEPTYLQDYNNEIEVKTKLFTKILNLIKKNSDIEQEILKTIQTNILRKEKVLRVEKEIDKIYSEIDIEKPSGKKKKKIVQEFSYKLIISVEGGNEISTINKIIDSSVKFSDLEKNINPGEIFLKYFKDKERMYSSLKDIFIKKSDFINIDHEEKYSDFYNVKTTKLKTIPYYINKLFTDNASIVFNIDGGGREERTLSSALQSIEFKIQSISGAIKKIEGIVEKNKYTIKSIPDIQKIILYKLSEMKNPDLYDKRDNFIRSYNKYNLLRYGDKHNMFNTIDDIMVYWRGGAGEERGNKQRINRPDIELVLEALMESYVYGLKDFGLLLISFSKGKEMDIKFYRSKILKKSSPVIILHHSLYNDDYILSNVYVGDKKYVTVDDLYSISELHKKWIDPSKLKEENDEDDEEMDEKLEVYRVEREYHYDLYKDYDKMIKQITNS